MKPEPLLSQQEPLQVAMEPFFRLMMSPAYARRSAAGASDFLAGNPQESALPELLEALQRHAIPQHKDWFAYGMPSVAAREAAAAGLKQRIGLDVDPQAIVLTRGAHAAMAQILQTVVEPGDEVIFISPPWFFYQAMIVAAGGKPVRVKVDASRDLDVAAIARSLTPETRAVIINTPNNPTGRIYPPETLRLLAEVLREATAKHGRPVYLVSDEAYSRIIFDAIPFHSPAEFYEDTFVVYTYSKTALAPAQRLGYFAVPRGMQDRERVLWSTLLVAFAAGHSAPDAVMQYALPDIEKLCIDVARIQRRRDRMVDALRRQGYDANIPEGTFYLLVRSPVEDDVEFCERLAGEQVYVLPDQAFEMPGYFRISLTATDEMVDRALPVFESAVEPSRSR